MRPDDAERFRNGDTLDESAGIPVIRDDTPPPPPPPGGYLRPVMVPVVIPDNRKPKEGFNTVTLTVFGLAVFAIILVTGLLVADRRDRQAQAHPTPPHPSQVQPSQPQTKAPEPPKTEPPKTEPKPVQGKDSLTCDAGELPVSFQGTVTCATEKETCALGSSYVPMNSNCGMPAPSVLVEIGADTTFGPQSCVRLVSGTFEDGQIQSVDCDPMSGVSAIVVAAVEGLVTDFDCYGDDGSMQTFRSDVFNETGNRAQTVCFLANDGA